MAECRPWCAWMLIYKYYIDMYMYKWTFPTTLTYMYGLTFVAVIDRWLLYRDANVSLGT